LLNLGWIPNKKSRRHVVIDLLVSLSAYPSNPFYPFDPCDGRTPSAWFCSAELARDSASRNILDRVDLFRSASAGFRPVFDELHESQETLSFERKLKLCEWCAPRGIRRSRFIVRSAVGHQRAALRNRNCETRQAVYEVISVDEGNEGPETVEILHCFVNVVCDGYLVTRATERLRNALDECRV
jgi:hypothetical protein